MPIPENQKITVSDKIREKWENIDAADFQLLQLEYLQDIKKSVNTIKIIAIVVVVVYVVAMGFGLLIGLFSTILALLISLIGYAS
jgi:ABC-type transport system involved in cytochrome bd biosynthesis fused ATPase/permease subunit